MAEIRFKPVALKLHVHTQLLKIVERKTKEIGSQQSPPGVVEMLINKFGDKV